MFIIRWILGRLILLLNFIFSPKKLQRKATEQAAVDAQTKSLQLYQYAACPFCVKVRRDIRRNGLNIVTVDAKLADNKQLLASQGGKVQVPCLRIEENNKVSWMYESSAISTYLNERFA
ncbi:glutathione S-transferase N-terminal domain-containing protein [Psychromonas hadalis]|uniref:glutathione S-transferase N-terminal domain-containing protein n=1 Tax=Psychromonas hadalis TaxID=211669 RepID=UPI0003B39AC0|nr:glutathione S-transferase N-terminal domain-containing protein [Psychromonas hadalis]